MRKRDYRDYLNDIFDSIGEIESFTGAMRFEEELLLKSLFQDMLKEG